MSSTSLNAVSKKTDHSKKSYANWSMKILFAIADEGMLCQERFVDGGSKLFSVFRFIRSK